MSKAGLVILLTLLSYSNYAQDYFVLIQANNRQPFYVRLNGLVYSSSEQGHLILSQLKGNTYNITIGLPGQTLLEQTFTLRIQKDLEFSLKDQGEKGWALFDEQTRETKSPEASSGGGEGPKSLGIKKDDAFSRLMADVVRDTAVLYNTYAMEQVLLDSSAVAKATPGVSSVKTAGTTASDSALVPASSAVANSSSGTISLPILAADTANGTAVSSPGLADSAGSVASAPVALNAAKDAAAKPRVKPRTVFKLSERKLAHSLRLAYADRSSGKKADTIIMFIPLETPPLTKDMRRPVHTGADSTRIAVPRGHGPNPDSPLQEQPENMATHQSLSAPAAEKAVHSADTPRKPTKSSVLFVNSDCHNYATDYDVDKLRVKLLEAGKDEDRVISARKVFKTKCFTTHQIRALSEVFTNDAAKFHFFETAYPFCSDDQFRELGSLLADPVYKNKFRVMTEH